MGRLLILKELKMLTGKGANKMKDGLKRQYNTNVILGEDSSMNKINIMTALIDTTKHTCDSIFEPITTPFKI